MKKFHLLMVASLVIAVISCLTVIGKTYAAAPPLCSSQNQYGRCSQSTFYTDYPVSFNGGIGAGNSIWTWPNGHLDSGSQPIKNVTDFINVVQATLFTNGNLNTPMAYNDNCGAGDNNVNDPCVLQRAQLVGDSFIVNVMLGKSGPDFGVPNGNLGTIANIIAGVQYAQQHFGTWTAMVQAYNATGRFNPNYVEQEGSPDLSTYRADNLTYNYGRDVYYYWNNTYEQDAFVAFTNPDGSMFKINKRCGNVTGVTEPLGNNSSFELDPASNLTLDNTDRPTTATFTNIVTTKTSGVIGVNSTATRHFYIKHANGTTVDLTPYLNGTVEPKNPSDSRLFGTAGTSYTYTETANVSSAVLGDSICTRMDVNPATGNEDQFGNPTTNTAPATSSEYCVLIAAQPYFHVYGGDVSAGMGVGNVTINSDGSATMDGSTCTDDNPDGAPFGSVVGWNKHSSTYSGAGTQYAVRAVDMIQDFATAQNNTSSPASATPTALAFANDGAGPSTGNYGGNFVHTPPCNTGIISGLGTSGSDTETGPVTIPATSLTDGQHIVKYVKGDVYITGDITYADAASGWAGQDEIPSYKLIVVGGNIYIGSNVHQLDGFYYAAPDSTGKSGIIYTCSSQSGANGPVINGTLTLPDDLKNLRTGPCGSNQLVVNGSFMAKEVDLLRSCGTLLDADTDTKGEYTGASGNSNCSASNHAGEIFNYSPEIWLANPANGTFDSSYDSITSLPPVL